MDNRKVIGRVTQEEAQEISTLFERRNGLIELINVLKDGNQLTEDNTLYEKVVTDLGSVSTSFNKWWQDTSSKYSWESRVGYRWEINFDNGDIYLVKE